MKKWLHLAACTMVALFVFSVTPWHIHHTWTEIQATNTAANCTSCSITISSTGAGHLGVVGAADGSTIAISSVLAADCTSTWTNATAAKGGSGSNGDDIWYCTNLAGSKTTITFTCSASCAAVFIEASATGTIALDSGATPAATKNDAACTSCAGASLTVSANNKFIAIIGSCGDTCTGVTGTGYTFIANSGGNALAYGLNIATSGAITAPTTFAQSSSQAIFFGAVAFQETGAAGVIPRRNLLGVGTD